jgi:hypothetical protein
LLVALAVLPALILSPLSAEPFLIHNHHGHDLHFHPLSNDYIETWPGDPEDLHAEHDHQCQTIHEDVDECLLILIAVDLPGTFTRGRSPVSTVTAAGGLWSAPHSSAILIDQAVGRPSARTRPPAFGPDLRPYKSITSILQSNHALLL